MFPDSALPTRVPSCELAKSDLQYSIYKFAEVDDGYMMYA